MLWRDPFALMTSQLTRPSVLTPPVDVAVSEDDLAGRV